MIKIGQIITVDNLETNEYIQMTVVDIGIDSDAKLPVWVKLSNGIEYWLTPELIDEDCTIQLIEQRNTTVMQSIPTT